MKSKTLLIILAGTLVASGLNRIAHLYYSWTFFDSILPFLPFLLLAVCAFMKHNSEYR